MIFYVYLITNLINGKIYIGKTNNPSKRWAQHKKVAAGGLEKYPNEYSLIHKAIKKYGRENFQFEIIKEFITEDSAYSFEEWYIEFLDSKNGNLGYNLTSGGKGGLKPSAETIIKKSLAMLGKKVSKETKEKLSILNTGINNPNFGLKRSGETLLKMSKKQRGENNPQAKITENQVLQIRKEYETGKYTYDDIAIKFGLKKDNIYRIITRKIWKHI